MPLFQAASLQGRVALGPRAGAAIARLGRPPSGRRGPSVTKELCAELDGFTLHAAVRIRAGEAERLEHLCRYVTRPPLSTRRLSLLDDGRVVHELRAPFRDGTTHLVFEPLVFLERLAALVPPPRMHQLTYHGVLAPAASWRDAIVPRRARDRRASGGGWCSRYSWPELMRRVFAVDVLKCARCGSSSPRGDVDGLLGPGDVARVLGVSTRTLRRLRKRRRFPRPVRGSGRRPRWTRASIRRFMEGS